MSHIQMSAPEMVNREWKVGIPSDKPTSTTRGRRLSGQTKQVKAMMARLKVKPKLRWW